MSAIVQLDEHRNLRWKREEKVPGGGIVYVTDKYDDAFSEGLLNEITELFNRGMGWEELAEKFNRPLMEVLYALLYQVEQGKVTRPFAYREGENCQES